jgi:hypothetical protein
MARIFNEEKNVCVDLARVALLRLLGMFSPRFYSLGPTVRTVLEDYASLTEHTYTC